MKNFSTWLLVMFIAMFWIFRVIVAVTFSFGIDFMIKPLDINVEIIILFVTLIALLLIIKRNMLGSIIYIIIYGWYFGGNLLTDVMSILNDGTKDVNVLMNAFVSFIAIILPVITLFDLLLDKNRKAHPIDKKTDWYYKNKEFDREMDDRADKNNYRL